METGFDPMSPAKTLAGEWPIGIFYQNGRYYYAHDGEAHEVPSPPAHLNRDEMLHWVRPYAPPRDQRGVNKTGGVL